VQVTSTSFTIAEYCSQMERKEIIVNREYQRSPKIWPPAARSYLIDTILLGFPIPKLSLYQRTDLKTRKTIKEIVDGQQRSQALFDFYSGALRISGKSAYSGRVYSQLDEPDQQRFLAYALSVDIFVGATPEEIRQVFRRMNSYTVPLNPQEKRHATHQGAFKWFIVEAAEKYAQLLKDIGVFTEAQLSRMADASLLTEIVLAMVEGIQSASEAKLDNLYASRSAAFSEADEIGPRLQQAFDDVLNWAPLHNSPLMRSYNFYTLILAASHTGQPISVLKPLFPLDHSSRGDTGVVLSNLTALAEALEQPSERFWEFVEATEKATNRIQQRQTRFRWLCRALQPQLLE